MYVTNGLSSNLTATGSGTQSNHNSGTYYGPNSSKPDKLNTFIKGRSFGMRKGKMTSQSNKRPGISTAAVGMGIMPQGLELKNYLN